MKLVPFKRPRRVHLRRFDKMPEGCAIVPLHECRATIERDYARCGGLDKSKDNDEPCECCLACRYFDDEAR